MQVVRYTAVMSHEVRQLTSAEFPPLLSEINDPPKSLFAAGNIDLLRDPDYIYLCVVGSRKYSSYGKQVCETLIAGLRGYNICIVSGLALGTDAIAHRAALNAGLPTIAVPGSGLSEKILYPQTNINLARDIVRSGGALLSEFEPEFKAAPWSFPQRNRIMAGMSHATLVIEATEKSGTLITSRLATEYNRDVMTVPGSIFSANSSGPNMLLSLGATPVRSSADILDALGIDKNQEQTVTNLTPEEQSVIELLDEPKTKDELIRVLKIETHIAQILLARMELNGLIVDKFGTIYKNGSW